MPIDFPLSSAPLSEAPLDLAAFGQLEALIQTHLAEGRYPGCQVALAYKGHLLLDKGYGDARLAEPMGSETLGDIQGVTQVNTQGNATGQLAPPGSQTAALPAQSDTLWALYSNTKIMVATTLWKLMEQGKLRFSDKVADHLPEFAAHGKGHITLFQVITHQGGFPNADVPPELWLDHAQVRAAVADFPLEWPAGSRVHYHSLSAHWVLAMVIEAITGQDFREAVNERVLVPLGLDQDLFVGLPDRLLPAHSNRMAYLYEPSLNKAHPHQLRSESTSTLWQQAGVPGGGAYGTARGMVALYQMMLQGGTLNGVRLLSPRTLAYALRNYTEERVDEFMGLPMHRGLGPHFRGESIAIRGLGSLAPANVYGHGGVGTSYVWADPNTGISFAYISNSRVPDPWHSIRLDQISNAVHAAIRTPSDSA